MMNERKQVDWMDEKRHAPRITFACDYCDEDHTVPITECYVLVEQDEGWRSGPSVDIEAPCPKMRWSSYHKNTVNETVSIKIK